MGCAPFDVSPSLGECQRSLSTSSFSLFLFVNHHCAKKWGNTTVCNGAAGVLETAMGGMPGWAVRLLARLPALTNAKVWFYVFFLLFLFVNHLCAKKWGCTTVCSGAAGVVETAMDGMPGWAACLLARCLTFANANVRFYVFFFVVLVC